MLHEGSAAAIAERVRGAVFVAERYSDGLPELRETCEVVPMSAHARGAYDALRDEGGVSRRGGRECSGFVG